MFNRQVTSRWRGMAPAVRPLQETCNHLLHLSTDFLVHMLQSSRDVFIGAADWVAGRRAAKIAAQTSGFKSWTKVLRSRYLNYWGHAAGLPASSQPPIRMVLGIRNRHWLLLHGAEVRRQLGYWPNHNRFLQFLWEQARQPGQPLSWQIGAQDRQLWRQWAEEVMQSKGVFQQGFYASLRHVDLNLHGRCLVQHHHGYHLLPVRLEPVEPPYPSPYVDVRAPPLRRLARLWTLSAVSLTDADNGTVSVAMVIQPPNKNVRASWVRRERMIAPRSHQAAHELLVGLKLIKTVLESNPTHQFASAWALLTVHSLH